MINQKKYPKEDWVVHENSENVPAIISKEIWNTAQEILKKKVEKLNIRHGNSYYRGLYPLSGKIICGN